MKYLGSAAGTPPAKRQRTSLGSPHTPITSSPLNTSGIKVAPKTAAECGLDASAQSLLAKRPSSVQGLISLILLVVQWMNEKRRLESIEDIGDLLTQYAAEPARRTFSTLTKKDLQVLYQQNGFINCGTINPSKNISAGLTLKTDMFHDMIHMARKFHNPSSESGSRSLIDIFLLFAIDGSREKYPHENNVIFHEEVLTHPNIPGLGQISGPVDYLIGPSALNLPINTPVPTSSNLLVPGNSVFLVVEAKKASTVADQESVAQVLAQLLALELAEDSGETLGHSGVVTDGQTWQFFAISSIVKEDCEMVTKFLTSTFDAGRMRDPEDQRKRDDELILGVLAHMIGGCFPSEDETSPLWFESPGPTAPSSSTT